MIKYFKIERKGVQMHFGKNPYSGLAAALLSILGIVAILVLHTTSVALAQPTSVPAGGGMLTWLASNPAWSVLIFVLVCMIATRVLDTGLRERIPKWALPIVSTIIGITGQMSVALLASSGWEQAIILGIASGLGGSGFYSAGGKFLPKMQSRNRR